jgi:hypothetical protein
MSAYNIKCSTYNFTIKDGYFFNFVHSNDILFQKNTNGDVVFTYPLTTSLGGQAVLDACFDGVNFWTLQAATSTTRAVKKWRIESNTCDLIDSYSLGDASDYCSADTFSIESFSGTLGQDLPYGSTSITLSGIKTNTIPAGTVVSIGPNSDGFHEEVTITGTISGDTHGLDFFTSLDHSAGENVSFVNNFWLFSDHTGTASSASLQCYNLIDSSWALPLEDTAFNGITGSTFYIEAVGTYYLLYVSGTTIRFFNIETNEVDKTITIDNLKKNGTTVIPVYGLEVGGDTIYRLQNFMTYYGTDYSLSTYNYQCTPIRSFIDSVSMEVYPKILPSNGTSISTVKTAMQDQYGEPAQYKAAHLSDDDDYGYLTIDTPLTNLEGVATSYYRAGLEVRQVTITALATQYD